MSAGYSGTPLAKKLGYAPGLKISVIGAPTTFARLLDGQLDGIVLEDHLCQQSDIIHVFVSSRMSLEALVSDIVSALQPRGALWVSWPKKSSGVSSDITEDTLREVFLPFTPMVDVKVCAIDDTWSGLKFVRRKNRR